MQSGLETVFLRHFGMVEMFVAPDSNFQFALPPEKGMADTPELLADVVIQSVGTQDTTSWLDPCAGSGRLVEAMLRAGTSVETILAVDLQAGSQELKRFGVECLLGTDFLQWAQTTERRFDRIVANPPFVRLRELEEILFRPAVETHLAGVTISAMANYWVPFLIAGLKLLKPGGSLAYILPAAWEYADYATQLRTVCTESFSELDVHRTTIPMFESVDDGCVLLVGRGFGKRPSREARVFRHSSLAALSDAICEPNAIQPVASRLRERRVVRYDDEIRLGDIAQIRIGAVTGDARYFLLTESQRLYLELPESAVRPILSKAGHLIGPEIDDDAWTRLLSGDKRVWLFEPSESDLLEPSVRAYLDLTFDRGGCRRDAAKIRNRDPWYRVPVPEPFDGFATGMSPSTPWVALNHMQGLTISNTLYGIRFPVIRNVEEQTAWCLSMLSSRTAQSRAWLAREYPQGLLKLEPSDMMELVVRRPKQTAGVRSLYYEATSLIATGHSRAAQAMVDDWLE